jgi:monoamine oxidase
VVQQGPGKGYSGLVTYYAQPVVGKIRLSSTVTRIDYTSSLVVVTYVSNGMIKQLTAKNVIVTVPLGVLQQGSIAFVPSLPQSKLKSISKLGMGLMNKCIMVWPDASAQSLPWPSNVEWIEKIAKLGDQGKWTLFYNGQAVYKQNLLIGFSEGMEALRVEALTDAQILAEALQSLHEMFGTAIPAPSSVIVSRWHADPYSRGSYSYYRLGSRPSDRTELGKPVGALFFAGEATHLRYPSTTHGALMSGQRAALQVVTRLKGRRLGQR